MLASFLAVSFFGFIVMAHVVDGSMQTDCPFSAKGSQLCPQNAIDMVVHHIAAYQSFLNAPVNFGAAALLFALISVTLVFFVALYFVVSVIYSRSFYESPPSFSYKSDLMRWLSLFENSPVLS